jgi:SAM-dependent methyltransferase
MQPFAAYYDFYDGIKGREDQLRLYRDPLSAAGNRVLELACGTGIVALELARAGLHVVGLDVEPDALAVAREKSEQETPKVRSRLEWVEEDMAQFSLGRKFDAVLLGNNAFGYLRTLEAQRSSLRAVRRHLREGGTFVLEERFLSPERLVNMDRQLAAVTVWARGINPATGLYTTFNCVRAHLDSANQLELWRRYIEELGPDGQVRRILPKEEIVKQRYFTPQEMRLLLEEAGFAIENLYGDYRRQPLTSKSRTMIFVCRAGKAG